MVNGGNRRIDRILEGSYLEGLGDLTLEELRAKREECEEEEWTLSFIRKMLFARLDIIEDEAKMRTSGAPRRSIIERLPEILADEERAHRGSFPRLDAPPMVDNPKRHVERLIANDTLIRLPELSDDEIASVLATLRDAESAVSESRRAVQAVLDPIVEELARRLVDA
jgi:hypothetical protein